MTVILSGSGPLVLPKQSVYKPRSRKTSPIWGPYRIKRFQAKTRAGEVTRLRGLQSLNPDQTLWPLSLAMTVALSRTSTARLDVEQSGYLIKPFRSKIVWGRQGLANGTHRKARATYLNPSQSLEIPECF